MEAGAIDHGHGDIITPMTEMLDSAVDNMTWGQEYLQQHPVEDKDNIMGLFDDTVNTLNHFKKLQLRGHQTFHYLENVQNELVSFKQELVDGKTDTEHMLAEYVQNALEEVHVARYLEEHHVWPDGVPLIDHHGEFPRSAPRNVHGWDQSPYTYQPAHEDYQTFGHRGFMANDIEATVKAAASTDLEGMIINI